MSKNICFSGVFMGIEKENWASKTSTKEIYFYVFHKLPNYYILHLKHKKRFAMVEIIFVQYCCHTFQPPSSSKREVCNKPTISPRCHHGCQNVEF